LPGLRVHGARALLANMLVLRVFGNLGCLDHR